jgi:hypothetical protein
MIVLVPGLPFFSPKSHLNGSVMGVRERVWAVLDPQRF